MKFCVSCGRSSGITQAFPQSSPPAQQFIQQSTPSAQEPMTFYQPSFSSAYSLSASDSPTSSNTGADNDMKIQSSAGQKISFSAAIIGVICFFLPWVEVSCMGLRKSASGLQLATDMKLTEVWIVLLVLLAAVALVLFQIIGKSITKDLDKLLSLLVIGTGIVPLLIMLYEYIHFSNEISKVTDRTPFGLGQILGSAIDNSVNYQFGGILSVIVSVAVAIGGLFHLLDKRNRKLSG
jgi:hypothetical protein